VERGDVVGLAGALVAATLVDGALELLPDAPRPLKSRDRVRFHTGTSEIMARVLLLEGPELAPGGSALTRLRLEAPVVAQPGDRFVVRSYSPIVTIGGGTLLDVDPRVRLKAAARLAHLRLLAQGGPAEVVEEHVRSAGGSGTRLGALAARAPFAPGRVRELLEELVAAGRALAIDRDWFLHTDSFARLRGQALTALERFHRAHPLRPGMSREELRSRAGGADERVFAHLLARLAEEGTLVLDRDKVRLASHAIRLSDEQQRLVDRVEQDFLTADAAPPSPEDALGRAGLAGGEDHELFQLLVDARKLVRVKESLFFHARALESIQDRLVAMLRERKEIGPADIKDLLGISRKYAIPLLEYFDARRVTQRVGERRILRPG
jgi:selenocysteine-specific elongation factor